MSARAGASAGCIVFALALLVLIIVTIYLWAMVPGAHLQNRPS
jgi:hypothetical protein